MRAHVLYETEWGLSSRPYVSTTAPVPDEIVIPMVLQRLQQPDIKERGYILDGFPRNLKQHRALVSAGFAPKLAVILHAPRDTLSRRIRHRRLDPETDVLYNLKLRPPLSQEVLERLVILAKDSAKNVAHLFESYGRATAETHHLLAPSAVRIDADRKFDLVLMDLAKRIGDAGFKPLDQSDYSDDIMNYNENQENIPASPPPRTEPRVVIPPDAWGASNSTVGQVSVNSSPKPMIEASAMRARRFNDTTNSAEIAQMKKGNDEDNSQLSRSSSDPSDSKTGDGKSGSTLKTPKNEKLSETERDVQGVIVGTKSKITLIRCDGYICERESVEESQISFRGAATEQVMLMWNTRPKTVLLLVKKDPELMGGVLQAAKYLSEVENMQVLVESWVQPQALANGMFIETFSNPEMLHEYVDFVVCLGGDGLILHVSTLFTSAVPPVISFNLGSLGFLTPFQFEDFQQEIQALLQGNCNLSLRMRLSCQIQRKSDLSDNNSSSKNGSKTNSGLSKHSRFSVLNEVVVDRGASPYLSNLDCFCDGKYITTVQADGIIMSTPTGSTAYSMSAGGSMVHPSVPAILFTPICPHSLSFRPIVFPDSAELRIEIAEDSRSHAWASFDGKSRQQLRRGDGLVVKMNLFPVPTVNKTDHTGDWFQSLDRAFNFNCRAGQKPLYKVREPAIDDNFVSVSGIVDDQSTENYGDENASGNGNGNGKHDTSSNSDSNSSTNQDSEQDMSESPVVSERKSDEP